ncbi:MAG TPA: archaemetzincin [Holophagaceae bacterium]|nr:archaemetzincin [Holophagaceae bacterium]
MRLAASAFFLLALALGGAAPVPKEAGVPTVAELRAAMRKLQPLHQRMGPPMAGDWLSIHKEPGQTFREYLACDPVLPQGARSVLYVRLLGEFTPAQRRILALTSEFMGLTFNRPVKTQAELPLALIPLQARRVQPGAGNLQILTSHVLDEVLRPRLPANGAAELALTATDLWPGKGWQFVFGEASLSERVGVWSIYRYGDPGQGGEAFRLCLLRSIATATHETGHMFSMLHCTKYACNMNGSETLEESDRQPLALCPECLAKLCWATGTRPEDHLRKLADFCAGNGLKREEAFYRASMVALGRP